MGKKEELLELGKIASYKYFLEKTPLTESVIKLAEENDLNSEEIKRVCESANKSTMLQIYKSASDPCDEFELASYDCVMKKLGEHKEIEKESSSDYNACPPYEIITELKVAELKEDFKTREEYLNLKKEAQKLEITIKNLEDEHEINMFKVAGAMDVLYDVVKKALQKGYDLKEMISAALSAIPTSADDVKSVFSNILSKLKADPIASRSVSDTNSVSDLFLGSNLLKMSNAVNDVLKDNDVPGSSEVVNTKHHILDSIRMIVKDVDELKDSERFAKNLRNRLKFVRESLGKEFKEGFRF